MINLLHFSSNIIAFVAFLLESVACRVRGVGVALPLSTEAVGSSLACR